MCLLITRVTSGPRSPIVVIASGLFTLRPWACTLRVLFLYMFYFCHTQKYTNNSCTTLNFLQSEHIWVASTQSKKHQPPRRPPPALPDTSYHSPHPTPQGNHNPKFSCHCLIGDIFTEKRRLVNTCQLQWSRHSILQRCPKTYKWGYFFSSTA